MHKKQNFIVSVCCLTYNHASYIDKTLNGFTMQETAFPYVCVIIDDSSIDGEPEVISHYMQEHFDLDDKLIAETEETEDYTFVFAQHKNNHNCYFSVFYLKYNHYQKNRDKFLYVSDWLANTKYRALCEGDDYWTDPRKLQIQFEYMEGHPECTMTCHRVRLYSDAKKIFVGEQFCRHSDGKLNTLDIINRTGLYIPTCSILYRLEIKIDYPDYCHNCSVWDYPLQICAAMKGTVYYFDALMGVYRIQSKGSWSSRQKYGTMDYKRLNIVCGQTKMFEGFSRDYPKYEKVFRDKIAENLCKNMPIWNIDRNEVKKYIDYFSSEFSKFTFKWRIYRMVSELRVPYVKYLFRLVFLLRFTYKIKIKRYIFC